MAGAVLVGGASSRMGVDKALVDVGGAPLGRRAADALRDALGAPPMLIGAGPEHADALEGIPIDDLWPGEGPVGGVLTAMHTAFVTGARSVVVVACDLPAITPDAVAALVATAADGTVPTVVTVEGRRAFPNGVWPLRVLPLLEDRFADGADGFGAVLDGVEVRTHDGGAAWVDADEPGDLARFR